MHPVPSGTRVRPDHRALMPMLLGVVILQSEGSSTCPKHSRGNTRKFPESAASAKAAIGSRPLDNPDLLVYNVPGSARLKQEGAHVAPRRVKGRLDTTGHHQSAP